jgi:hypothetical protein
MVVTCKECNKIYKTYNSWYIHNKRIHNPSIIKEEKQQNTCEYCSKTFTYQSNCSRHKKKCKELHEKDKILENKITVLENKINELSNSITNNTIQYNTINIQQNNYIGCIPSQLESIESIVNIYKKITYEEYIKYIYDSSKEKMLYKLTEYIFATNKLNEYKNIYIPVFNSDIIYKYNTSKKTFVKCDKQLTLNMYMNKSMTCIENLILEFDEDNYDETIKIFEALNESQRVLERINNENIIIIHNSSNNITPIFNEYNKYIE